MPQDVSACSIRWALTCAPSRYMMCRDMTLTELIAIFGSRAKLATAIREGETTVRNWFIRGSMPWRADDRIIVAAAQLGRLVTPSDLHDVRREIAEAAAEKAARVRHDATVGAGAAVAQAALAESQPAPARKRGAA